jgi:hypothetical protein
VTERFVVAEKCTRVGGDLLQTDFGSPHQLATQGPMLQSEGVERSRAQLRRTHAALAPGGASCEKPVARKRVGAATPTGGLATGAVVSPTGFYPNYLL